MMMMMMMKKCTLLMLLVLVAAWNGAAAATTTDGEIRKVQDEDGENDYYYEGDDYEPWDNGTPIYYQFDDGWYEGTITGYSPDTGYKTTWSDGDIEFFDDLDLVNQMVYDYSSMVRDHDDGSCEDAWPAGTKIWVWEDNQGWWGQVTICQDGVYTASWENGDVGYYDEGEDFDKMVTDAKEKANNGDSEDNFKPNEAEHDFTSQTYDIGTIVYKEFEDGWYEGTITAYTDETGYTISWEDGTFDVYPAGSELDQMVADAVQILDKELGAGLPDQDNDNEQDEPPVQVVPSIQDDSDKDKKSGGAIFALLLVLACGGVLAFWVQRRRQREQKFAAHAPTEFQDGHTEPSVDMSEGQEMAEPEIV